jgi:nitrile hydratase
VKPKFEVGARVRVLTGEPDTHCRTPWYLRGKRGVVADLKGTFRDPEKLAYNHPGWPKLPLYTVRFTFDEVWPGKQSAATDTIEADIYQHWLAAD